MAEKFDGVSAGDIANAVFSAANSAMNEGAKSITQERFEKAIQSTINVRDANAGTAKNVREISHEEARRELGEEKYREAVK